MSFASAFYNFSIDLNHIDRDVFCKFRVKVALHPEESLQHLYARILAFAHAHREGLSFTQGLFEPKAPTAWCKDVTNELMCWIQVGVPERKKLESALRHGDAVDYRVYFYEQHQTHEFCQQLRGSKTNWVKPIQFFGLEPTLLDALVPLQNSSPNWNITFVDNHIYLSCDGHDFESDIVPIDIWSAFQDSLLQSAEE